MELVDALERAGTLKGYHLLHAVRGDLLEGLGRHDEARRAFQRAAAMTANEREQALLERRAEASANGDGPSARPAPSAPRG
jgi:predicted RNA polymerase sigma factor